MSNGEIKKTIPAGEETPIQKGGDFIFCKFAEKPVRVLVNGQPVTMRAGDNRRFPRKNPGSPAFDGFIVGNDGAAPVAAIFVVGEGDFNSQIVTGELTVAPGIKAGGGEFQPDTRESLNLALSVPIQSRVVHSAADVVHEYQNTYSSHTFVYMEDKLALIEVQSSPKIVLLDADTMAELSVERIGTDRAEITAYNPADGRIYFSKNLSSNKEYLYSFNPYNPGSVSGHGPVLVPQGPDADGWYGYCAGFAFAENGDFYFLYRGEKAGGVYENYLRKYAEPSTLGTLLNEWDMSKYGNTLRVHNIGRESGHGYFSTGKDDLRRIELFDGGTYEAVSTVAQATGYQINTVDEKRGLFVDVGADDWVRQLFTRTVTAEISASTDRIKVALLPESSKVTADVIFAPARSTGYKIMAGEVIKAAVQAYMGFNEAVPDDYLDYIYRVEFFDGERQRIIGSGSNSFALEAIEDNFRMLVPGDIKILTRRGVS